MIGFMKKVVFETHQILSFQLEKYFRPVRLKWLSDHFESNLSRCHPIF